MGKRGGVFVGCLQEERRVKKEREPFRDKRYARPLHPCSLSAAGALSLISVVLCDALARTSAGL
jgi:hypothetical protein